MIDYGNAVWLFLFAWLAGAVPFAYAAFEYRRESRGLMDYIIGQQAMARTIPKPVYTTYGPDGRPAQTEPAGLDRATRIYQDAMLTGEIDDHGIAELMQAGGIAEPVKQ